MTLFIAGIVVFFGTHLFTAFMRDKRDKLVAKFGGNGYRGLYSLIAIAGFVMIVMGWRNADASILYSTPAFMRHITYGLMLIAIILLVAAYAPAGRITHAVKHPMLAGVKVWAFAHLLVNGEVRSVILFGAFLAFAVADRIAVKRRSAPIRDAGPARNDVIAVAIGGAAYALIIFFLHRYIAGVSLT
jgi:uncharacterized membrane protein